MNTKRTTLTLSAAILAAASLATPPAAASGGVDAVGRAVTVQVRTDDGRLLPFYPAPGRGGQGRFYAEAVRGDRYSVVVRNNLDRRVGVVIAVDGRNIISGKKSWLGNDERMYIVDPWSTQEFSGWRTSQDRINRFYFTTVDDSYAAAFKDESAMGVIAVAAFAELPPPTPVATIHRPRGESEPRKCEAAPAPAARSAAGSLSARDAAVMEQKSQPGTGYGQEEYSPSHTVAFSPEASPREKTFIKYEWRETLCRLGVIPSEPRRPANRLWDGDFAPPPPNRGGR
jgi:hypothetical protein